MNLFSNDSPKLRRARPLLGTFVEVSVPAVEGAEDALKRAFAIIALVEMRMSAHQSSSDLGRIAALRKNGSVSVHPWTWFVLKRALRFHALTGGTFDPAVAARKAVEGGMLPAWGDPSRGVEAEFSSLKLLPGNRVKVSRSLRLDLGGIAKGFAVDQAVRSLKRAGLAWGLVNAGGDLRAFGGRSWPIHVRCPDAPGELAYMGDLHEGAMATSAPYFSQGRAPQTGRRTSALVDPRSGNGIIEAESATVFARTCLVADALTKAVLCQAAGSALRAYQARAFILSTRGVIRHAA
jgi:thiamine biosynthesis lipoprotein